MSALFGDEISITPHVEPRSLMVAYCLGVVITFLAVVGSSWKISRLERGRGGPGHPGCPGEQAQQEGPALGQPDAAGRRGADDERPQRGAGVPVLCRHEPAAVRHGPVRPLLRSPSRPVFSVVGVWLLFLWLLPEEHRREALGQAGRRHGDVLPVRHLHGDRRDDPAGAEPGRAAQGCLAPGRAVQVADCRRCGPRSPIRARPGAGPAWRSRCSA